ncbi:MAG TPA: DUF6228 family protein [Chthoniobacterales bacterium]|jgi:hypothetical protein
MGDSVTIRSAQDDSVLELHRTQRSDTFRAHLRGRGFEGAVEVYELGPPKHLATFFRDLAVHWRGWQGEKHWGSLESQLSFRAKADSTGHTYLDVELRGGSCHDWRLRGSLVIEAGQLDKIASEIESFVELTHAA